MSFPFPINGSSSEKLPITTDMLTHAYITLAGGFLSLIFSTVMFFAYLKYHQSVRSFYNDLYVLGIGTAQCVQALQMIIFALFVVKGSFSGLECNASAILNQFSDATAQLLTAGFALALLMLRSGDFKAIGCTPSRLMRLFCPGMALAFAFATTLLMLISLHREFAGSVTYFEMSLGWCWVPDGHTTLRIVCAYGPASVTFCVSLVTLLTLRSWSYHTASMAQHAPVYMRLGCLMAFVLVAYLGGSIARFGGEKVSRIASLLACFMFPAAGMFISVIFLATESLFRPLFTGKEWVPSMGFSGAVNSIVQGEVVGVPVDDDRSSEANYATSAAMQIQERSGLLDVFRVQTPRHVVSPTNKSFGTVPSFGVRSFGRPSGARNSGLAPGSNFTLINDNGA
jgi:hypothetical protein